MVGVFFLSGIIQADCDDWPNPPGAATRSMLRCRDDDELGPCDRSGTMPPGLTTPLLWPQHQIDFYFIFSRTTCSLLRTSISGKFKKRAAVKASKKADQPFKVWPARRVGWHTESLELVVRNSLLLFPQIHSGEKRVTLKSFENSAKKFSLWAKSISPNNLS